MADAPLTCTPEQLLMAWQQRRRPSWPASYEACMADPLICRLVRAKALGLAQAARQQAARTVAAVAEPTRAAARPASPPTPRPVRTFDPKRLAAGDTPDDDD